MEKRRVCALECLLSTLAFPLLREEQVLKRTLQHRNHSVENVQVRVASYSLLHFLYVGCIHVAVAQQSSWISVGGLRCYSRSYWSERKKEAGVDVVVGLGLSGMRIWL